MEDARYTRVAIALHWLIAVAIFFMLFLGFVMEDISPITRRIEAFQLHKSLGLTILALSLVRLGWRLSHRAPPLPAHLSPFQKLAAIAVHWALYGLMIAIPLSGWLMISASSTRYPTRYYGLFDVPLFTFPETLRKTLHHWFHEAHELFAFAIIALLIAHVGAALLHHIYYRDTVLTRMLPRFLIPLVGRR
jgi:cytochrome b561